MNVLLLQTQNLKEEGFITVKLLVMENKGHMSLEYTIETVLHIVIRITYHGDIILIVQCMLSHLTS